MIICTPPPRAWMVAVDLVLLLLKDLLPYIFLSNDAASPLSLSRNEFTFFGVIPILYSLVLLQLARKSTQIAVFPRKSNGVFERIHYNIHHIFLFAPIHMQLFLQLLQTMMLKIGLQILLWELYQIDSFHMTHYYKNTIPQHPYFKCASYAHIGITFLKCICWWWWYFINYDISCHIFTTT